MQMHCPIEDIQMAGKQSIFSISEPFWSMKWSLEVFFDLDLGFSDNMIVNGIQR